MTAPAQQPASRIDVIDALRGSALAGILLLHAIAHWSLPRYPTDTPAGFAAIDRLTMGAGTFLFEGKAFAIFALMFGVSFSLILETWSRRGVSFGGRFAWRLALLAMLGYLHGIIYSGEVLMTLAVLGLPLLLVHRLGNRALAVLAVLSLLQVPSLWEVARHLADSGYRPVPPPPRVDYGALFEAYAHGSFADVCAVNAVRGQVDRLWWAIESGRYLQMFGLFVCGLLAGRQRLFEGNVVGHAWARRCAWAGLGAFALLFLVRRELGRLGLQGEALRHTRELLFSYRNLAQVAVWVGGFQLLYRSEAARRVLRLLAPYGRMSLTSYVAQALVGVPLFYGYGLALYRHFGPFQSLLAGMVILLAQGVFAHVWLRRCYYGPLEWLWRSGTFLDFSTPLLRRTSRRE